MARRKERLRNQRPRSRGKKGKSPREVQILELKDNDDVIFSATPQTAEDIENTLRRVEHLIAHLKPSMGLDLTSASSAFEAAMRGSAVGDLLSSKLEDLTVSGMTSARVAASQIHHGSFFPSASAAAALSMQGPGVLGSAQELEEALKNLDAAGRGLRDMAKESFGSFSAEGAMKRLGGSFETELTSRAKLEAALSSIHFEALQAG